MYTSKTGGTSKMHRRNKILCTADVDDADDNGDDDNDDNSNNDNNL